MSQAPEPGSRSRPRLWWWASDRVLFLLGVTGVAGVFTWLPELAARAGTEREAALGSAISLLVVVSTVQERARRRSP